MDNNGFRNWCCFKATLSLFTSYTYTYSDPHCIHQWLWADAWWGCVFLCWSVNIFLFWHALCGSLNTSSWNNPANTYAVVFKMAWNNSFKPQDFWLRVIDSMLCVFTEPGQVHACWQNHYFFRLIMSPNSGENMIEIVVIAEIAVQMS